MVKKKVASLDNCSKICHEEKMNLFMTKKIQFEKKFKLTLKKHRLFLLFH